MRSFRWVTVGGAFLLAQPIDITQKRIDPLTFTFEDGRTTLTDYVLSQIRQHTTCCGVDNVYVEIRITPDGTVESVRTMTGRNDCYKQSVKDIIQPTLWKVENFRSTRPIYYELRFSEECKGTDKDNVYTPIPPPKANAPIAQAPGPKLEGKKETQAPPAEPKVVPPSKTPEAPKSEATPTRPIPITPSLPGTTEPKEAPLPPKQEEEKAPSPPSSPPKPPSKKDSPPQLPQEKKEEPPTRIGSTPAKKGFQPGQEPPKEAQPPNPPAVLGKLPTDTLPTPLKVQVSKEYRSTGEKRPPQEHVNSYVNTSGPRYGEPDYINGPIAKALYLKQEYRKRGVCGLVHVLLEVAIDAQGNIRGYRILKANRPDVEIATPRVLAGMKYKPVPLPTVFYTEFKIDVDCQSDRAKIKLDTVPDFLSTPEGKLIRPPIPKP
ncbi:MAG: hypothetical protein NZ933_07730 [Bacteroidia bacterium]|nr:hypothetical protein [Bacteroidia bacterium]